MAGSKLRPRHPHPLDDRDREVDAALDKMNAALREIPASDLDAPLSDSAEVAKEDRYWADIRERLERLLADPDLSEKTQSFLESLDDQLTRRGALTGNQVNAIIEIEDRRDSGKRRY